MSKFKLLNIFEMYVSEFFRETSMQLADKSVYKFFARRVTRNTTKGILPSERYRIEKRKKSLQQQLRLAHNCAAENNLIPENLSKMNRHQLNFLTKNFTFLYIFENQILIDMFFGHTLGLLQYTSGLPTRGDISLFRMPARQKHLLFYIFLLMLW